VKSLYCAIVKTADGERVLCDVLVWPIENRKEILPDAYVKAQHGFPFDGQSKIVVNQSKISIFAKEQTS
jgi:hypothetical protein